MRRPLITVYDQSGKLLLSSELLEKKVSISLDTILVNANDILREKIEKSDPKNFRVIYETPGHGSGHKQNFYTDKLKLATLQPLNGMKTKSRIEYMQGYKDVGEPELAIVLDPENRKAIFGYNFWAVRLTEFCFWNEIRPSYWTFRSSLKKYLKVEKRLGK